MRFIAMWTLFSYIALTTVLGIVCAVVLTVGGCQSSKTNHIDTRTEPDPLQQEIATLQNQVLELQGTVTQINNFNANEYDTCSATGDGTSTFVQQVCKIAQSATADELVQLKAEIGDYVGNLNIEVQATSTSLAALQTQENTDTTTLNSQIASINTQIGTINTNITTLQGQMTSANAAITALQTTVNGITNTLNDTLTDIEIGTENLSAGPLYESIERRNDKTKIVAYVKAFGTPAVMSNNPLTATNGSNSIKVLLTAHGLNVGSLINLNGLTASKGFVNTDITGYVVVASVIDANDFMFLGKNNATSSGTFGGNGGTSSTLLGQGLGLIWNSASGASVLLTTSYGTPYNFIVQASGNICYSTASSAATFATISAVGGNVVCK